MASIIPKQKPSPHVAPNVSSPLRRASSQSSIPTSSTPGGSKLASPLHSRSSTSEFGDIPGTFPRDPRIALDHLSDKSEMTGTESSVANNGTIFDAAREDWRHAVDVASQFLPGTVVGAFGYAFPFGSTNPEETEKGLQEGGVGQAPSESSKFSFDPKNLAVGGIVSDFNPSSSRSRATPSSTSGVGANSDTPKKPFTSPSVAEALDSTAPKSESESNPKDEALGPSAVPASKEKKDNDIQEVSTKQPQSQSSDLRKRAIETSALGAGIGTLGGAAYESSRSPAQPSSKVNPKDEDLTSTGSSGVSTSEQSAKEQPAFATYAPAPVITDISPEDAAKPTSSASDSIRPSNQASSTSTSAWNTRGRSEAQKALNPHRASGTDKDGEGKKKAIQAAALGAGIGTVGGVTYAHSQSPKDSTDQVSSTGTAQPQVSGGKLKDASSAKSRESDPSAAGASGGKPTEDQPAFVSYAPAPVITEDYTPDVPEDDDGVPPTSSVRDGKPTPTTDVQKSIENGDSDSPSDSRAKKGVEGAALGAGAGALGGAAYQHSRKNDKQKGDDAVAPAGYADKKYETKSSTKVAPGEKETRSYKTRDTGMAADQDVPTNDAKAKKRAEGAALGAGAGVLGGAAYAHSRRSDQDAPVDSTETTSSPSSPSKETPSSSGAPTDSLAQPASKPAATSTDTSGSKDMQKGSSQSDAAGDSTAKERAEGAAVGAGAGQASSKTSGTESLQKQTTSGKQARTEEAEKEDASQDSKTKNGFWSAALIAGAGVLGGAALRYSHKNGEDDSSTAAEGSSASQPRSQHQHQTQSDSQSKSNTDQSPGTAGSKDVQSTDKKGMAAAAATGAGAGAVGSKLVADKKREKDQHAENRNKEAEKREKDVKRHEKDSVAAVAAPSSDKRSATKKEDKRDTREAEKQHQAAKREKEVKNHEKDVAAAGAVAGDSKRAKRAEGPKEPTQSQQDEKAAKNTKTKDQSKGLVTGAAGGTALGAGAGLAANSLGDAQKHQPSDELPPSSTTAQQTGSDSFKSPAQQQAHPSTKAASNPPRRPGPIAHGAAGPYDAPKEGADSDFPLPSANASSTDVVKAVDIDGSGKPPPAAAVDNKSDSKAPSRSERKTANTAAGVVTAGSASRQSGEKSRYHGSEGLQEKQEGGQLRSSTIERMRNGRNGNEGGESGNGNGNGNGKKEGFVKHIVEKVKDKLHHHDK